MNNDPKLMLSSEEQQLVSDTHWILTKRVILEKVSLLLGALSEEQKAIIETAKDWLPPEAFKSSAKISKGENYLQLPYLLLDHPRCFNGDNIFAIRTMFWWGNFFSVTLQLSGTYKALYQQRVLERLSNVQGAMFICINESQWQHHFEADNYVGIEQVSQTALHDIVYKKQFLKLAVKFPLTEWNAMPALLQGSFRELAEMLKDQLPRR